jgi:hypothetical protein
MSRTIRWSRARLLLTTVAVLGVLVATSTPAAADAPLTPELERALATSAYVYLATERKDGNFGTPAEIWFMWDQNAVWVASPTTTWRVKRIRAGRTKAQIAVGARTGPSFTATGTIVQDPAVYEKLYVTFARKYPEGWTKYEARFREGLKDGSRVLMKYQPARAAAASPVSARPSP